MTSAIALMGLVACAPTPPSEPGGAPPPGSERPQDSRVAAVEGRPADLGIRSCVRLEPPPSDMLAPILPMHISGAATKVFWDTGWPNLALAPATLPALPRSARPSVTRNIWSRPVAMIPLEPVDYVIAGRTARFSKPERIPESMFVLDHASLAGIAGVGALSRLASRLDFTAPDALCLSGPPCDSAPKPWVEAQMGGVRLNTFVDSGALETTVLRPEAEGDSLSLPGGVTVKPTVSLPGAVRAKKYSSAVFDGRQADVVLGWKTLRGLDWTWSICTGAVTFSEPSTPMPAEASQ